MDEIKRLQKLAGIREEEDEFSVEAPPEWNETIHYLDGVGVACDVYKDANNNFQLYFSVKSEENVELKAIGGESVEDAMHNDDNEEIMSQFVIDNWEYGFEYKIDPMYDENSGEMDDYLGAAYEIYKIDDTILMSKDQALDKLVKQFIKEFNT